MAVYRKWVLIAVLLAGPARADYITAINPRTTWGTWEGWGASLCWWANVFGTRNDLADLIFTTNYTTLNGQSLPGLGLNIARYNVGACTSNALNTDTIQLSPNIPAFRRFAPCSRPTPSKRSRFPTSISILLRGSKSAADRTTGS